MILVIGLLVMTATVAAIMLANHQSQRRIYKSYAGQTLATEIAAADTTNRTKSKDEVKRRIKKEEDNNPDCLIFLHDTSTGSFPNPMSGNIDFTIGNGTLGPGFYTTMFPAGLIDAVSSAYDAALPNEGGGIPILLLFKMRIRDFESLRGLGPVERGALVPGEAIGYDYVFGPYGLSVQFNWQPSRGGELLVAGLLPPIPLPTFGEWHDH